MAAGAGGRGGFVLFEAVVARGASGFRGAAPRAEPVLVNGAAGLLVRFPARSLVAAFTVANGRIVEIDIIADPAKLGGLGPS